jgi:hypothetical protein
MPCLRERSTDSRTYAALPIIAVINGHYSFLHAETVSPLQEILLERRDQGIRGQKPSGLCVLLSCIWRLLQ